MQLIQLFVYRAVIKSKSPDAALPFTALLVSSFPSSASLFPCPFVGLSCGFSVSSGIGVEDEDRGGEDAAGAVINLVEKAVGSKTGGDRSFDTGPSVMVIFVDAFSGLRCDGLISSKISSSSSLSGSG